MRLALAIASLVILVVHGLVFYDQFFHRWERHQTAYFDQARSRSTNEQEKAELNARRPRIEQILVTQFGETRVDRCTTCHIAADDPRFQQYAEPLKTHPYSAKLGDRQRNGRWERRHKFADFGCTVCHDGQGRGLQTEYAHGVDEYWTQPMLGSVVQPNWRPAYVEHLKGSEYLEVNCVQCHSDETFAGTPTVARGRQLFFETNCYGCHKIEGLSEGTLGPELTEVGRKWQLDYIWESVADPRANLATSFMPKFALSSDDIKALTIFLKSRKGINLTETSLDRYRARLGTPRAGAVPEPDAAAAPEPLAKAGEAAAAAAAARGQQLVQDKACGACHRVGGADGGIAPDLSRVGLQRDGPWLLAHFKNPRAVIADSIMPSFRFTDADFAAMVAYLSNERASVATSDGKEIFQALCQRCHGEKGDGNGPIATYLDPYPRDLTKAAFMTSKAPERLLASIKQGVGGTSMPPWGRVLTDAQVQAVYDYVFAAFVKQPASPRKRDLPAANPAASDQASIGRGERTFLARCTGCHGRKADGKGPNSLDILPRPRNLRNAGFVNSVGDQRLMESILYGVQGSAMPSWIDYGLSKNDAGDLVNFIRSLNPRR
jgi:sulfur oxidation c-type cytochrome SoxX